MQNVLERMEAIGAERKMADFNVKMKMDYEFKKNYAYVRAWEFYNECCARGLNQKKYKTFLQKLILLLLT